jgi:predicted SAM-dependent methyltransferase
MRHQRTRDLYFAALRPVNRLNYWRWRLWHRFANGAAPDVHLGCGPKYLPGFVNVDGNLFRRVDRWLDLRNGLPFRSGSVASVYASHVFEHFYADELERLFAECRRVLRSGGGLRLVVPDMEAAARAYVEARSEHFRDFPRAARSLGGKLSNLLFCEGGHRIGLDFSHLEELLSAAGFARVERAAHGSSRVYSGEQFARLAEEEAGVAPYSLFAEAFVSDSAETDKESDPQ